MPVLVHDTEVVAGGVGSSVFDHSHSRSIITRSLAINSTMQDSSLVLARTVVAPDHGAPTMIGKEAKRIAMPRAT